MLTSVRNGKRAALYQRQHVDAVADAARLHQQHGARAAEIGAGDKRHAFLLGRQRDRMHAGVGERAINQNAVTRIRNICNLRHAVRRSRS